MQYGRVFEDFTKVPGDFFRVGDQMTRRGRPRLRLGKRKKSHRWGFLNLLLKYKEWKRILSGELVSWEQLRWRPILGYAQNVFGRWYNHLGSTLQLLSQTVYYMGDSVLSTAAVQQRVLRHNLLFLGLNML